MCFSVVVNHAHVVTSNSFLAMRVSGVEEDDITVPQFNPEFGKRETECSLLTKLCQLARVYVELVCQTHKLKLTNTHPPPTLRWHRLIAVWKHLYGPSRKRGLSNGQTSANESRLLSKSPCLANLGAQQRAPETRYIIGSLYRLPHPHTSAAIGSHTHTATAIDSHTHRKQLP